MSSTEPEAGPRKVTKAVAKGGRTRAPEELEVPHLSVAERAARGRAARGEAPRRVMRSTRRPRTGRIRSSCCSPRQRRGCRSWCRFGMGGCWCRRLRSIVARRF